MNIFEKLIDELKEENLLEATVIENNGNNNGKNKVPRPIETYEQKAEETRFSAEETLKSGEDAAQNKFETFADTVETGFEFKPSAIEEPVLNDKSPVSEAVSETITELPDASDFFFRRAKEEVASLQMVEHILSGVERDQMKIIPKAFDDMAVKTALHKFGQVAENPDSSEHSQAEFQLMQETENWYSVLSQRDKNITVGHLRRFCETTRPALSSQALLALARFYRNAPYSEAVRSKFDLIITRLLSRENDDDRRELIFGRDETVKHLEGLYAEWSSISLYSPDKDDSTILLAALKFEDFMVEVGEVDKFDDLIKKDFFNRLRAVKESTSENFFAPVITTAAIECNVKVGNRYVELLRSEDVNPEILINKYGVLREEAISDVTGKTLQLAKLLSEKEEVSKPENEIQEKVEAITEKKAAIKKERAANPKKVKTKSKKPFVINKWLLIAAVVVILGNAALFFFSNEADTSGQTAAIVADKVNLENSVLKEHLDSARMANGIFYGRAAASWNTLTKENKEAFLRKIVAAGKERGFDTVHLLDKEGKPLAYAKGDKVRIN